ncbi:hypothetical protein [Streptomyces antimycoticus]|uniref:hypothetical protein n=1 Tax=Streptomyces antimycoticus TaxID=68175 RepID=UPI0031EE6644
MCQGALLGEFRWVVGVVVVVLLVVLVVVVGWLLWMSSDAAQYLHGPGGIWVLHG